MLVILCLTGLWLLLYGMNLMKSGLENAARDKLRSALKRIAGTPAKAVSVGLITTMFVQSSTAISVMTVGFVNTGVMTLTQAIGILLGSNVGTCVTVQIIAFDLTYFAWAVGLIGISIMVLGKRTNAKSLGKGLFGFGIIFTGLKLMAVSMAPLQNSRWFLDFLFSLSGNPLLAVAAGTIASALLHSSAAATGIVMLLAGENLLPLTTAIAIVLGNNIGTCITAVLASLTGSTAGKRVALSHVVLNVAGAILFIPILSPFAAMVTSLSGTGLPRQVANAHTLFNIISSIIAFPFIRPFARLMQFLVPGNKG